MNTLMVAAIRCSLIFLLPTVTYAVSAQWDLDPISGDWNTADNWTPMGVPNGQADTATFALSNTTSVSISANTEVEGITFTPAATNSYTITASPGFTLTLSGTGITNNSGITQNFVTAVDGAGRLGVISFTNSATAGSSTLFTNNGALAVGVFGGATDFSDTSTARNGTFINNGSVLPAEASGFTQFRDTSTAGNGTFINNGGAAAGEVGGFTVFRDSSTAANGTFINSGGAAAGTFGGSTQFNDTSTAGSGTFINNGGAADGASSGFTEFLDTSTAGSGTFINNGAAFGGIGTAPGRTQFDENSTADSATLIANGGTNGGPGGVIVFFDESTGGTSRVEVFGNGTLDIFNHSAPGVTIGSIEGDGNVFLGGNNLTVGSNNLSTTFSGVIQDGGGGMGGSLTKIGTGTLDLTGANTYTGSTNVNRGVLQVDGSITSNTFVNHSGTLAGTGTVQGNVTNTGGIVSPGDPLGTLTVTGSYTQAQFATLMIQIAGANAGQFSVLDVLGKADLNGTLDPVLLNGFIPTIGQSFVFLDYASLSGAFSHIENEVFNNGTERWEVTYQSTEAILTATKNVPDQASTLLLLTLGLLGLVMCRRQLLRG